MNEPTESFWGIVDRSVSVEYVVQLKLLRKELSRLDKEQFTQFMLTAVEKCGAWRRESAALGEKKQLLKI